MNVHVTFRQGGFINKKVEVSYLKIVFRLLFGQDEFGLQVIIGEVVLLGYFFEQMAEDMEDADVDGVLVVDGFIILMVMVQGFGRQRRSNTLQKYQQVYDQQGNAQYFIFGLHGTKVKKWK